MRPQADRQDTDFRELSERVYRLCLALLGTESAAQDASQEAVTRAWARRAAKRADVPWWTWVAGFAVRVCRETVSRSRRNVPSAAPRWIEETADSDGLAALHEAVLRLPQRQREVVVLRFLLSHSTEQTAVLLDCPQGTVKSNLHKAIKRLHRALSATGQ